MLAGNMHFGLAQSRLPRTSRATKPAGFPTLIAEIVSVGVSARDDETEVARPRSPIESPADALR